MCGCRLVFSIAYRTDFRMAFQRRGAMCQAESYASVRGAIAVGVEEASLAAASPATSAVIEIVKTRSAFLAAPGSVLMPND